MPWAPRRLSNQQNTGAAVVKLHQETVKQEIQAGVPLSSNAIQALQELLKASDPVYAPCGLTALSDETLGALILHYILSPSTSSAIASKILLPRLLELTKKSASRDLLAVVGSIAMQFPVALVEDCFRSLFHYTGYSSYHGEVIIQTTKECPNILPGTLQAASSSSSWNEHTVNTVQALIKTKPVLNEMCIQDMVNAFSSAVQQHSISTSTKFCKLLLSVLRLWPDKLTPYKEQLGGIVEQSHTFMTKTLITAVERL